MRKKLTTAEQVGLTAELDQIEAELRTADRLTPTDGELLKRFQAVSAAVVPLLYDRHGAAMVYAFVRSGAYSRAIADWYVRFADDPTGDAETHYQFFASYLPASG